MKRTPLTDAAAIAEYEDDISMATAFLTLAENQELQCYRLRSINAELVNALEAILATWEGPRERAGLRFAKNMVDARAALERAKQ